MSTYSIARLISFQRALDQLNDESVDAFISSLAAKQIRWLLSNFLGQFLPHLSKNPKKPYPSINSVHSKRLSRLNGSNQISNNSNNSNATLNSTIDLSILESMKDTFVNDYFKNISSRNPLSINTSNRSSNKCIFLKSIPKNLLSNIISFLNCRDRSSCCSVSYVLYQACNDPISKQEIELTPGIIKKTTRDCNVNLNSIIGYKNVNFGFSHWDSQTKIDINEFCQMVSKCQHLTLTANKRYSYSNDFSLLEARFLAIMRDDVVPKLNSLNLLFFLPRFEINKDTNTNRQDLETESNVIQRFESILKQCHLLTKLQIKFNTANTCYAPGAMDQMAQAARYIDGTVCKIIRNSHQSLSQNPIANNRFNLVSNLKYLEYDARFYPFYIKTDLNLNMNVLILENIKYLVNLETLKLDIAFPKDDYKNKNNNEDQSPTSALVYSQVLLNRLNSSTHNKNANTCTLAKLEYLSIACHYVARRSNWDRGSFHSQFDSTFPDASTMSTSHWNDVMLSVIQYLLRVGGINLKNFGLSCPQWTSDNDIICNVGYAVHKPLNILLKQYCPCLESVKFALNSAHVMIMAKEVLETALSKKNRDLGKVGVTLRKIAMDTGQFFIDGVETSCTAKKNKKNEPKNNNSKGVNINTNSDIFSNLKEISLMIGLRNCDDIVRFRLELTALHSLILLNCPSVKGRLETVSLVVFIVQYVHVDFVVLYNIKKFVFVFVFSFVLEVTFVSYHKCDNDQLYLNGLHSFLGNVLKSTDRPFSDGLKFLKISKLSVDPWRITKIDLNDQDIGYRAKVNDVLKLSTQVIQQTSIECISLGGLKLSQAHIDWIKFWFINPFGEYSYDTSVAKKEYKLKPFDDKFRYRPGSGILTLSAWKQPFSE